MKSLAPISLALAFCGAALAQKKDETPYPLTEDSKPHDGVPKGEVKVKGAPAFLPPLKPAPPRL